MIQVFYRPPAIFQCVRLHISTPPPASMMMNAKKHSGKRKSYIPSDRPRNNADRDALKYAKTPSMYGYIKLPIGRPTKTIDSQTIGPSPSTADTALTPATAAAASRASLVKVKMSRKTRGSYNKHNNKSGRDAWVTLMLLNNDRKIANKAMFKADPQSVVLQQTLNSLLNSAKAKINAVTSGDLGTEYDMYQRMSQASDTSSLTTNSDREDNECQGFKFAPPKMYQPYLADKEQHHPPKWYWCNICEMGHKSHIGRSTKISANLYVYHHDTDDDMIPSPHLNVEVSNNKKDSQSYRSRRTDWCSDSSDFW